MRANGVGNVFDLLSVFFSVSANSAGVFISSAVVEHDCKKVLKHGRRVVKSWPVSMLIVTSNYFHNDINESHCRPLADSKHANRFDYARDLLTVFFFVSASSAGASISSAVVKRDWKMVLKDECREVILDRCYCRRSIKIIWEEGTYQWAAFHVARIL